MTEAIIALGSNLHDPFAQLGAAKRAMAALGESVGGSSLYQTKPVGGPAGQADYLNAVLVMRPRCKTPYELLQALQEIEKAQGRQRKIRWDARTLDLDVLAWGDMVIFSERLTLPHPRMMQRAFVCAPLCEAAPHWRHPVSGVSACDALKLLGADGVKRLDGSW